MDIKKLIKIKEKERFEVELEVALGEDFESLPLDQACEDGGFPDPMSVTVYDVEKTGEDKEHIYAAFSASFTEAINTSCANCTIEKPRYVDCSIVIDKVMEEADFSVKEVEYKEEF